MSAHLEPDRLLSSPEHVLEQSVLSAARVDAPPPGAKPRVVAALGLGVGAGVVVGTSASAAQAASGTLAGAGAGAGTASGVGVSVAALPKGAAVLGFAAKWVLLGAVCGGASLTVTSEVVERWEQAERNQPAERVKLESVRPSPRSAERVEANGTESPVRTGRVVPNDAPGDKPPVEDPVDAERGSPHAVGKPAHAPPALGSVQAGSVDRAVAHRDRQLRAEVAVLERARAALSAGDARRTLVELEAHRKLAPAGALAPEAQALRIEALAALGKRSEAAEEARDYLARHPATPAADRVRDLLRRAQGSL